MEELWSFGSVIALWIGVSCALWWLHRRRVYGAQKRQLEQAARAIALIRDGQTIFDKIRTPVPVENAPQDTGEWLRAETHGLLRRIQDHGDFFDKVNTLRVQLQASAGIEDHTPLSEILNLRRDLWAASEILLVEDPKSFGATFAEDGAYERFHAEALQLLFKGAKRTGDDLIDLRLSLAANDAESFAAELAETIEAAREKDRLPTVSEAIAYPLAFFRAIPRQLATAYDFGRAFLGHAADTARAMRESETMVRGASRLRQAQEDWPQRLSAGFERASTAARGSATALQRHYDFLVTAYDFQTKYEQVVRRAPEITERGRQFIARLELAERSERLRLTSANAAVWMARRSLDGLAHLIAGLQRAQAALSETAFWRLAGRLLAPAPLTGRRTSPFRSYRRALAIAGLSEAAQQIAMPPAPKMQATQKAATSARKAGKVTAATRMAAKPKAAPKKVAAAEAVQPAHQSKRSAAKSAPASPPAKNAAAAASPPAQPKPARPIFGGILAGLTKPRTEKPAATSRAAETKPPERKAAARTAQTSPAQSPASQSQTLPKAAVNAKATPAEPAAKPSRGLFSWRKQNGGKSSDATSVDVPPKAGQSPAEIKPPVPAAMDAKPTAATPAKAIAKPPRGLFSWRKPAGEETPGASIDAVAPEKTPAPAPMVPEKAATTRPRGLFSWRPKAEREPETVAAATAPKVEPPQPAAPVEKPAKQDRAARKKVKRAKSKSADVATRPEPGTEKPQATPSGIARPAKLDGPMPPASSPPEDTAPQNVQEAPADMAAGAGTTAETPPQKPEPIHTAARQSPDRPAPAATPIVFDPDELDAEAEPEKRPSFFKRLFMRKPKPADTGIDAQIIERLAAAYAEQSEAAPGTEPEQAAPVTVAPRLMEKLSSLGGDEIPPDAAEEESVEDDLDDMEDVTPAEDAEEGSALDEEETGEPDLTEPGPLTLSILELQSKMKSRTPQIRSFPWLRE